MLHASEAKASVLQERVIISIILQTSSFPPTHPGFQRVSEGVSGRGKAVAARSSSLVELAYFDRALVGLAVWYKTVALVVGDAALRSRGLRWLNDILG